MTLQDADLAVLGAGAAGMMTALCAAGSGLRVALVDPMWSASNNLAISGGLFPVAGSRLQRAAGIADSPDAWLSDLHDFAGESTNLRIASSVAHALPGLLDFLLDEFDAPLRFLADVPAPGHSAIRFHSVMPASGALLSAWLRSAVARHPAIQCHVDLRVECIERPRAARAAGAGFVLAAGDSRMRATRLMLAGGGFGAAPDMVREFIPDMTGALHSGSPTNDGSVIALARSWGAALAGMDGHQGQGHTNPDGRTRLGMSIPTLGGILVNKEGRRFVEESIGPSALAARILAEPGGLALEVFDEAIELRLGNHSAYAQAKAAGRIIRADTIEDLARLAGIDARQLEQSIGEAPRPLRPIYLASWVTGSLAHTQGGIATDGQGRVLTIDGEPMPDVYAAGGSAAGLSGRGGDGYLPGNGLAQSFGLAWLSVKAMTCTT